MMIKNPTTWTWLAAWVAVSVAIWAMFVPATIGVIPFVTGSAMLLTIGLATARIWQDSQPSRSVHELLHDTETSARRP